MEWIKLEDTPPREGRRVLVLMDTGEIRDAVRCSAWSYGFKTPGGGKTYGICVGPVTHWMPRPKDPKA
jgi:hypothetical protein